jgi:phosphate transport system ATP-binding protein
VSVLTAPPPSPAAATRPLVECEALSLRYGEHRAFADVSLAVEPRRITAIIGPSGCGKSSFLTCLNRLTDLIPGCRVDGRLRIGEVDVLDPATDVVALRRRVGMIFQKPNPFPLSIHRNLDLPLRQHGMRRRAERDAAIESVLRDVGLWDEVADRLHKPATSLSGGQQQRLCIARALALKPEVVLLDEPCSALDPISSAVVEDLIVSLKERFTLVIVTHNLAQARRIADRVAFFWMVDGCGRLVESGPCRQVFAAPREELTAAYVRGARG